MPSETTDHYRRAQVALADLKAAARGVLLSAPSDGLADDDVGRLLGLNALSGTADGQLTRTILGVLEAEGVATKDEGERWHFRTRSGSDAAQAKTARLKSLAAMFRRA